MSKRLYPLADIVFDNLVSLVCNEIERTGVEDFETRREYLGYMAELSEMLEELRKATKTVSVMRRLHWRMMAND